LIFPFLEFERVIKNRKRKGQKERSYLFVRNTEYEEKPTLLSFFFYKLLYNLPKNQKTKTKTKKKDSSYFALQSTRRGFRFCVLFISSVDDYFQLPKARKKMVECKTFGLPQEYATFLSHFFFCEESTPQKKQGPELRTCFSLLRLRS